MKTFSVTFTFRELPSPHMYQSTTVDASSIGTAVRRAEEIIRARPHVKGRRITQCEIDVSESGAST
jgi:hypothetical protein